MFGMMADDWMRAADRDREEIAEILREAYAEGRLDHTELDERTGAAFRAQTWGELRRLTADIPRPAPAASLPANELRRPGPPLARRALSLSTLMLTAAFACVVIGAAARSIAVVALAVLAGSAVAIRRG
jgi:hypothetical protein